MSSQPKGSRTGESSLGSWIMIVAGTAALAVVALWLWDKEIFSRWFGFGQADKARNSISKDGTPSDSGLPRGKVDEALLIRLKKSGASSEEAAARELDRVAGKDWRNNKAENLFMEMVDPAGVLPLTLLPNNGENAGVLRADFGLATHRSAEDALEMRKYLHEWHKMLGQLRAASLKALKDIDREKLRDLPTLALVKELAEPRYKALDEKEVAPPEVPWFTTDDQQTAELLSQFFIRSDAGKAFITDPKRVGLTRVPNLVQLFGVLHTDKTWKNIAGSWLKEIAQAGKRGVPEPPLDEHVSPVIGSFERFLEDKRWRKTVKLYSRVSMRRTLENRDDMMQDPDRGVDIAVNMNAGLPHKELPRRRPFIAG